jgi:hypothetical protein
MTADPGQLMMTAARAAWLFKNLFHAHRGRHR